MLVPAEESEYRSLGFADRQGFGDVPALVVVDFSRGFTDPDSPLACACDDALTACAELLTAARLSGLPVCFTTVAFDNEGLETARWFIAKAPALRALTTGSPWTEIDARIAPSRGEPVFEKVWPSAFSGTRLGDWLAERGVDTLVIAGASTSGCVRATVVDGLEHGFRVQVVREAVADRVPQAHAASLADMDAKYADVVSLHDVRRVLA